MEKAELATLVGAVHLQPDARSLVQNYNVNRYLVDS